MKKLILTLILVTVGLTFKLYACEEENYENEFTWAKYEMACFQYGVEPTWEKYEYLCENPQGYGEDISLEELLKEGNK